MGRFFQQSSFSNPVHRTGVSILTTKWKGFKSNYTPSDTVTILGVPVFNPGSGTYPSGQNVTITAPSGAQLKVFQPNPNLLDPSTWVLDSQGSQIGFGENGDPGENVIETRRTPYGTAEKVWVGYNLDTASGDPGADGGWVTASFAVDKTKLYRFSVWVRKLDSTPAATSGSTYLGCSTYGWPNVSDLTGTSLDSTNLNPYFWAGSLPLNDWHLLVGYVHPAGDLTTTSSSKVYNTAGQVVFTGTDFRWLPTTTFTYHRAYLYYCTELGIQQEFWNPRVEVVNSVNDPIDVLFATPESSPKTIPLTTVGTKAIQALSYSASSSSGVFTAQYIIPSDYDNDGLPDGWEMQYFGNLSQDGNVDYDGDGLSNADEFSLGYDPTNRDTGNTGLSDGDKDWDSDGLSNHYELYVSHSDPKDPYCINYARKGQRVNKDGAYLFAAGLGDTQADAYMHLIGLVTINGQQNLQVRLESTSTPQNIYTASEVTGPWTLYAANVALNADLYIPIGSGYGFFAAGAATDTDGDGLADGYEVLNGTSPTVADTDGDGYPDGWELANGYDPRVKGDVDAVWKTDSDSDGLPDTVDPNPASADSAPLLPAFDKCPLP